MIGKLSQLGRATVSTTALVLVMVVSAVACDQTRAAELPAPLASHLVLRVSDAMLNSLVGNIHFERQTDVRDTVLGTSVFGTARIVGEPRVVLAPSAEQATFYIVFHGTVCSRTVGYNGPAIIYSRSETRFSATRKIAFDPKKGFYALAPELKSHTRIFVDGIGSTCGGLVGRIVRRRAARLEIARRPEATEIVRQKTGRRIIAAFDRTTEERLARLNSQPQFRTLALLQPCGPSAPAIRLTPAAQHPRMCKSPPASVTRALWSSGHQRVPTRASPCLSRCGCTTRSLGRE